MRDEKGFDLWADSYDAATLESYNSNTYPFAGYMKVIEKVYAEVITNSYKSVLDIGFGTAFLTSKLYERGVQIFGQDFSKEMITLAQEKMPNAMLYKGDFTEGIVPELASRKYDAIIATYSLHHLKDTQKVGFIKNLLGMLNSGGAVIIGDVMFKSRKDLEDLKEKIKDDFDSSEYYFVVDEIVNEFDKISFQEFSFCSGVIKISN